MPLLTLDITSAPLTSEQRTQIQQGLTQLMASVLDKVAGLTVVNLRENPDRTTWSVGGAALVRSRVVRQPACLHHRRQ